MAATAAKLARPIGLTFPALVILRSVMRNDGLSKWLAQPPPSRVASSQTAGPKTCCNAITIASSGGVNVDHIPLFMPDRMRSQFAG